MKVVFQPPIFRGYVSFRDGNFYLPSSPESYHFTKIYIFHLLSCDGGAQLLMRWSSGTSIVPARCGVLVPASESTWQPGVEAKCDKSGDSQVSLKESKVPAWRESLAHKAQPNLQISRING